MHSRNWLGSLLIVLTAGKACAGVAALDCGEATVRISPAVMRGGETTLRNFEIAIKRRGRTSTYRYASYNDLLHVRCSSDRARRPVLLVSHACSGSACSESNFSIVDIAHKTVVLRADQRERGNQERAAALLGKALPSMACGESAVRCVAVEQAR